MEAINDLKNVGGHISRGAQKITKVLTRPSKHEMALLAAQTAHRGQMVQMEHDHRMRISSTNSNHPGYTHEWTNIGQTQFETQGGETQFGNQHNQQFEGQHNQQFGVQQGQSFREQHSQQFAFQQGLEYDERAEYQFSSAGTGNATELDSTSLIEMTGDHGQPLEFNSSGTLVKQINTGNVALDEFVLSLRRPLVWIRALWPTWRFGRDLSQGPCYQGDIRKAVIELANAYSDACNDLKIPANKLQADHKNLKKEHSNLQHKLVKLECEYANQVTIIRTQHNKDTDWMKKQIETLKKENSAADMNSRRAVEKVNTDRRREYTKLQSQSHQEIERLKGRVASLESDKIKAERALQHEVDTVDRKVKRAVTAEHRRLTDFYEPKIKSLTIDLSGKNQEMHQKISDAVVEYQSEIATLKNDHANELYDLNRQLEMEGLKHDDEVKLIEAERDRLIMKYDKEIDDLEHNHAMAFKDLEEQHQRDIQEKDRIFREEVAKKDKEKDRAVKKVNHENQTLKGALISKGKKQDKQGAMTDHQISTQFQDLGGEIDDLARTAKWDPSREKGWPVPSQIMKKTENERRTRQYVIQNTIWAILDEKVFRTPFRVLGRRGRSNDQKWFSEYGGDEDDETQWPYPTEESEKWKRDRIKEFYDVMDKQIAAGNPRLALKEEFDATIVAIREELMLEMRKISKDSHIETDRLEKIAKTAARLWIQCGMQWARIHVKMSSSGQTPARSGAGGHHGPQELIIKPEIRRSGNGDARFYDQEEVITDGAGKFSMV